MDARKLTRFATCEQLLACPVCGESLRLDGTCLACSHGHRFDIARQGYVNLLRGVHREQHYDRTSFEQRRTVFASGLYAPIAQALCEEVERAAAAGADTAGITKATGAAITPTSPAPTSGTGSALRPLRIVDAGCGEGYFARTVRHTTRATVCAFDISRDSVQLAAREDAEDGISWLVADLAAIPVQTGAADVVLDVFSPAHYGEFRRILAPGGRLIKVVPTANHLREVRELAAGQLRHRGYSNERVVEHLEDSCTLLSRCTVSSTLELTPEVRDALVAMTPILFSVDTATIDWTPLTHATVEAEVLVGTW